jgi:hypothetical protein
MSDIRIVNLSSHQSPIFTPTKNKEWMLNGKDNAGYNYIIDRYKYSPTNSAIIDSYSNYINGKGLTAKYTPAQASEWAKIQSIITKDELRKICQDFAIFEESSVEIILGKSGSEIVSITHLPKEKVMPSVVDENGEISSYFYSYDWSDIRKYPPQEIPAFTLDTKEKRTVYIIKKYSISDFYFTRPSYFSGLNYAELEEEIAVYSVNHIKNGLSAGHIINFNDGEADTEVKDRIERNIDKKLAGSNNAGKRILSFNSNKENATTVEAIEISDAHQQYQFFSEEARRQLMVAHKVTSPILFGIKDNTGFGNNADEMTTAFDELMLNVIKPKQDVILEGLMYVLRQNKSTLKLEFIPLRGSAVGTEMDANQNSYNGAQISSAIDVVAKVKEGILTKEQAIVFLIQFLQLPKEVALAMFTEQAVPIQQLSEQKKKIGSELIELGEEEDLTDYELIECKPVDYEEEDKITQKFSLSTGTANPNRKSIYDNDFYIFRYRYAGNPNPEREFCKNMMRANKIYRREDIEAMGEIEVNPGFGMHPTPNKPYSIWKFKGGGLLSAEYTGGTCKHYWEKLTYKRKDVKIDPKSPIAIEEAKKDRASGIAGIAPHDI